MKLLRIAALFVLLAVISQVPLSPAAGEPFSPAPDAFIPKKPARLAERLTLTTYALRNSIERWRTAGDPSRDKAPLPLRLQALYQQRIYRYLVGHPLISKATIASLPRSVAPDARANVMAGRRLSTLVHPVDPDRKWKLGPAEPADVLRRYFELGQQRFHVAWEILAAVMYVESKWNRVRSDSTAGAQGPMQFIPSTWYAYGMGGDVHDPHDAVLGAANYLHASGAPSNYRNALYNYNHAWAYVDAVLLYARQMKRSQSNYYRYYNYQVFVVTTNGARRLTGPGL
jgi:hypothetical protein